jgi:putative ABC transport system substrate-binding protein
MTRKAFINEIEKLMGESNLSFIVQNAQGNIADAHTIARSFHANKKIDSFLAIGTPAAQALHSLEKKRPIFIAAVSRPLEAGLIYKDTNVCGRSDAPDASKVASFFVELLPDIKKDALIYTPCEINASLMANDLCDALQKHTCDVIKIGILSETEIPHALHIACKQASAIIAPIYNTVASAISFIASHALKEKKPLVVSDNCLVEKGALASYGVNYEDVGKETAQVAFEVLTKQCKPSDIEIKSVAIAKPLVNNRILKTLGLSLPTQLINQVTLIDQ